MKAFKLDKFEGRLLIFIADQYRVWMTFPIVNPIRLWKQTTSEAQ